LLDVVPQGLLRDVQNHIRNRVQHAEDGWDAGSDEEDTLTGDLGSSIRTSAHTHFENGTRWEWRISYKKFRGRGANAAEKRLGADGIVQVEVLPSAGTQIIITKGILFQAKKVSSASRRDLLGQLQLMEDLAPGGSAVFEYGPDGYRASDGDDILTLSAETRSVPHAREPLSAYLADRFLPCLTGLRGMYYNANRDHLIIPVGGDVIKIADLRLRHRIGIEIRHETRLGSSESWDWR
jgi:hypothetical protein